MTPGQLNRRIKDTEKSLIHEYENVSKKLAQEAFTKSEAAYLTSRAQVAPAEVLKEIAKVDPALVGKVKRCVNLLKKLNGNHQRFLKQKAKLKQ